MVVTVMFLLKKDANYVEISSLNVFQTKDVETASEKLLFDTHTTMCIHFHILLFAQGGDFGPKIEKIIK